MVRLVFNFLVLMSISGHSQEVINNGVTKNHTRVEGTNVYLNVPEGFVFIARSREFVNSKINASIVVNVQEISIDQMYGEMDELALSSQGSTLISDKPITVGKYSGYWIETQRETFKEKQKCHYLLFGVDKFSYVIQVIFPQSDRQFEKQARLILRSVVYRDVIPNTIRSYTMDLKNYHFEYLESKNNVDYYELINRNSDITVEVEQFFTSSNTDSYTIFYGRMQRLPFQSTELDEQGIEEITINKLTGWQATMKATTESGNIVYVYQLLLSAGNKHFQVLGKCKNQPDIKIVSGLAKTFTKVN